MKNDSTLISSVYLINTLYFGKALGHHNKLAEMNKDKIGTLKFVKTLEFTKSKAGNERNWDEIEVQCKIDLEQNLGATLRPNIWDTLYIYYIVLTLRDTDIVTFWHGTK